MKYPMQVKTLRLEAVAKLLNKGAGAVLEILGVGAEGVLARVPLPSPAASVKEDELQILGLPVEVRAIADGSPTSARVLNSDGDVVIEDLKRGNGGEFDTDQETLKVGQTTRCTQLLIIHP